MEHGGELCGILQLSVVAYCPILKRNLQTFDRHIKPPEGSICSSQSSAVHGLTLVNPKILNADKIEVVWPLFVDFIEGFLNNGERKGIIVAWGGEACDCEWLFRVTEESHVGKLHMPRWLSMNVILSSCGK